MSDELSASQAKATQLGNVGTLFSESWLLFKSVWLKVLGIGVLTLALAGIVIFVLSLLGLGANIPALVALMKSADAGATDTSMLTGIATSLGLIVVVGIIVLSLISVVVDVALLRLMQAAYAKVSYSFSDGLQFGFKKFFPLLLLSIFSFFIAMGGYWLFFFPGLLLSFFMYYSGLEIVLHDSNVVEALRESLRIVKTSFWGILGRVVLLVFLAVGGYLMFSFILTYFIHIGLPEWFAELLRIVVRTLLQIFELCYAIVLYNHAKGAAVHAKKPSLKPLVVTSIIGWVFFVLVATAFASTAKAWLPSFIESFKSNLNVKDSMQRAKDQADSATLTSTPTDCGISLPLPTSTDGEDEDARKWYYEEAGLAPEEFLPLNSSVYPRKAVLLSELSYKKEMDKFSSGVNYDLSKPGINVFCIENTRKLSLKEFEGLAFANTNFKVEKTSPDSSFGELDVVHLAFTGKVRGEMVRDVGSIAVSGDGKRLIYIRTWAVPEDDAQRTQIDKDVNTILRGITLRDTNDTLSLPVPPTTTSTAKKAATSGKVGCTNYNIREGKFASNKCYVKKDYDDLLYYLDRYNSAVFSYNSTASSMSITCNGSEFFKAQCEQDKQDQAKAQSDMGIYEGHINLIISRGK